MGVKEKIEKAIAESMTGKGLDDMAKAIAGKALEKTIEGYKDIEKRKNDELCKALDEWYAKVESKVDEVVAAKLKKWEDRITKLENL